MKDKEKHEGLTNELKSLTNFESTEVTNMFKVKDEELFLEIANRIHSENNVFVMRQDGKVGLFTYGSIFDCIPLEISDDELDSYDGKVENTLKHLQPLLDVGEEIILNSTLYDKTTKRVTVEVMRITSEKAEYIEFN